MQGNLFLDELAQVAKEDRLNLLEKHIKTLFCHHFYMENLADLPSKESLFDLGLTSLGAMEIKYELEKTLNIALDSTVLFNFPSVYQLVEYISKQKLAALFVIAPVTPSTASMKEKNYAKEMLQKEFGIE